MPGISRVSAARAIREACRTRATILHVRPAVRSSTGVAWSLGAGAGCGEACGNGEAHGVLDRDVEWLDAVARQVDGVAAEGVAHGEIDGDPIVPAVRLEHLGHVLASHEADCVNVGEP